MAINENSAYQQSQQLRRDWHEIIQSGIKSEAELKEFWGSVEHALCSVAIGAGASAHNRLLTIVAAVVSEEDLLKIRRQVIEED